MQIRDRVVGLRRVRAGDLVPNAKNWRVHTDAQRRALAGVLNEVGYADALIARQLADGALELLDGHLRAETTPDETVPVLVVDLDDAEAAKVLATLDPLAAMAEADAGQLDALLREIDTGSEGVQELLADLADQAGLYQELVTPIEEDEVPEAPTDPITRRGDLWALGKHRLLCGDSTNAEDVARVMDGTRAGLMNTDPPYGISYNSAELHMNGTAYESIGNDDLADEALQEFLAKVFLSSVEHALVSNAAWYLWHAHLTQGYFAAAAAANVVLHRQIIWVKKHLILGRGQFHWKHEPCFMGWVKGNQPPDYGEGNGERNQTTVWELDGVPPKEREKLGHPTPKPVELFAIPIRKHLKVGEICYEPFAGSGPQFVAAEQLGRRCFGIELSPAYCDVIVERWETLTGEKAVRG